MDLLNIIKLRKSERNFSNKKIDRALLREIIEAGRLAPSACNNQPWRFIIIDEPDILQKLHKAYPRNWFATAQCVIVICGNKDEAWIRALDGKNHCDIDISIAVTHITLMATYKGLGTCWVCNFNPGIVRETLQLPENIEPMVLLPIGYTAEEIINKEKERKSDKDIISYNSIN